MPLIVITGYPSCGKTFIVNKIVQKFINENSHYKPLVINNDSYFGVSNNVLYKEAKEEKKLTQFILSKTEALLNKDSLVIVDFLNYTKSIRYQLYCVAKSANSQYSVVHVASSLETSVSFNHSNKDKYNEELINQLVMRYEEPIYKNRWDSPLFTIPILDNECDIDVQVDKIWRNFNKAKTLKANLATQRKSINEENYLNKLQQEINNLKESITLGYNENKEKTTEAATTDFIKELPNGLTLKISARKASRIISIEHTLDELQMRFINMNKMRPVPIEKAQQVFVSHINLWLNEE